MSRQTGKAFHLYIEVLFFEHRHAFADVIWRSIGNTIHVLNIEAKSNKLIIIVIILVSVD